MASSGKFFATIFNKQPPASDRGKERWVTWDVGSTLFGSKKVTMFCIHSFSDHDSSNIDTGMKNTRKFFFTNQGHLLCILQDGEMFSFFNPLIANVYDANTTFSSESSIGDMADDNPQYVFDSNNVISPNLKYILHKKEGKNWVLLFNFLHTPQFKEHYKDVMNKTSSARWGADNSPSTNGNLRSLLDNYASMWQVNSKKSNRDGTFRKSYLDPTINMFLTQDQSKESALFAANYVKQDETSVNNNAHSLNQLGATGEGGVPRSLCFGQTYEYVKDLLKEEDTFMMDFPMMGQGRVGVRNCSSNMQMNICTINNTARVINVKNSSLSNTCGNTIPPEPDRDVEEEVDIPVNKDVDIPVNKDVDIPVNKDVDILVDRDDEGKKEESFSSNNKHMYILTGVGVSIVCAIYIKNTFKKK